MKVFGKVITWDAETRAGMCEFTDNNGGRHRMTIYGDGISPDSVGRRFLIVGERVRLLDGRTSSSHHPRVSVDRPEVDLGSHEETCIVSPDNTLLIRENGCGFLSVPELVRLKAGQRVACKVLPPAVRRIWRAAEIRVLSDTPESAPSKPQSFVQKVAMLF
ncbi:MAG: hypothetical protein ACYDCD_02610 [Candidatus Acidiferrales bacterium]